MLEGFGAEVLVYDPYVEISGQVELDELLERAQFLSLHARATPETIGMIGAPQIAAMPPGSVIVNCARGSLLDYDALCDALDSGHLFGAAVDVFPEEPIPAGSRLLTTPNLVMTPHLAGASKETAMNAAEIVAEDVARYVRKEPLKHWANPAALIP
jgi:D-3-phosphoglycerate dehydrogenase